MLIDWPVSVTVVQHRAHIVLVYRDGVDCTLRFCQVAVNTSLIKYKV